jgi:hypothetical protein
MTPVSWAPKNDFTRTTAKPPTTTTATINSGSHAARTTFEISNYPTPFLITATVTWPASA